MYIQATSASCYLSIVFFVKVMTRKKYMVLTRVPALVSETALRTILELLR